MNYTADQCRTAPSRAIIHLDMDAFYASVEMLDQPALRGRPVVVGGTSDRSVVSAASYEARKYGIHSAMPMVRARQLCPGAVFLPVRMGRYREISERIMAIFERFTPLVEPISLDEAFLDVTGSSSLFGSGVEIAIAIKRLIKEETGLTGSAGVATSKLLAKIASDLRKPDGLTVVEPGREGEFLAPLPIGKLWGVGKTTLQELALLGVSTIGDLAGCRRRFSTPASASPGAICTGPPKGSTTARWSRNGKPNRWATKTPTKRIFWIRPGCARSC
jgi:DNA polymerase IV